MDKRHLQKHHYILTSRMEILLGYLGAAMGIGAAFHAPHVFDWFGTQGQGAKLSLQISGIICQLISALMVAIKYIRSARLRILKTQYIQLIASELEMLHQSRTKPPTKEKIEHMLEHPNRKQLIDTHFDPVLNFEQTENHIVRGGIALYVVGALFLLVSAG